MIKLGIDAPPASRTAQVVQVLENDIEIQTLWYMANRTSRRAAVNDHGPVHVRTSMHHSQSLLRLLMEAGVQPDCIVDHGMTEDDARVVVLLGIALHDVGHVDPSRSTRAAKRADRARLDAPASCRRSMSSRSSRSSCPRCCTPVLAHNVNERCLTIEAGIVKVADALDMTKGRSRKAISAGEDRHPLDLRRGDRDRARHARDQQAHPN